MDKAVFQMCEYYLMNKNTRLMLFQVVSDGIVQYCDEVESYVDDALFPPGFAGIEDWIDKRNYAKHKKHLRQWLKEWHLDNITGFLEITHGLGLNDSLWVCPAASSLTWEQVNLYRNDFTDVTAQTAFSRGLHGLILSSTSPEFTSEGSFEKCWIRKDDGEVYLYKKGTSGSDTSGFEPYSEFYASQFSSVLCRNYVDYDLVDFKSSGNIVSCCKMFTNEDEGFVPIYKYLDSGKKYRIRGIEDFLKPYGFIEDFRDMIVLDSVIMNTDRHLGNFGFIVDNDTFHVKCFAPVFDNNMSLLARAANDNLEAELVSVRDMGHKLGADFVMAGKAMLTSRTRQLLSTLCDIHIKPHALYNLQDARIKFLDKVVHEQIAQILA